MKKVMVGLAVIAALFGCALAVVVATFDIDSLRPVLTEKLEKALGHSVNFEHLILGWGDGVAIQVLGIEIGDSGLAPLAEVESASAVVRLLPLFKKRLEIASIILVRPHLRAYREAGGVVSLAGLVPVAAPAAASMPQDEASAVSFEIERFRIEDGILDWSDSTRKPPLNIRASQLDVAIGPITPGRPMEINVAAAVESAQPNLHLSGRLTLPSESQSGSLEHLRLAASRLPVALLAPAASSDQPHLSGFLGLELQGAFSSLSLEALAHAASGDGRLTLDEPVIVNLNVLREAFRKLSVLPGVVQRLEQRLPPEYRQKLQEPNTVLKPIKMSAVLEEGWFRAEHLELEGDTFSLIGRGGVALTGDVLIRGALKLDPQLSDAVIRSVAELGALADEHGQIAFPITIQGKAPQVAVIPDLNAIASKVAIGSAVSALSRLLESSSEDHAQASPDPEAVVQEGAVAAPAAPAAREDLLGGILRRVIEKNLPDPQPAQ